MEDWLLRIVCEESMVSDIGRACLREIGYKSRWWERCNHMCEKLGLRELVDLLWLRNITKERMAMFGMEYDRNVWKKINVERIKEYVSRWWMNSLGINDREHEYLKSQPKNEKYANGSVEARMRLRVRGVCLPRF